MTIRMNEEQSSKSYSPPEMRSSQGPISSNVTDEGCPVIESGTVCGETKTLSIIKEFREIYDNCVQNMDQCNHDSKTLKKLAPFRKLVEDLWEQNAMLVETVEELEHETTCRVAMLQERLNQSNEKVADKLSDIKHLDLESLLKQKESDIEALCKELCDKDALLKKYFCQIDELRKDMKARSRKYKCIIRQLRDAAAKRKPELPCDLVEDEFDECDDEELLQTALALLKEITYQRSEVVNQLEETESQLKSITNEKDNILSEKKSIGNKLDYLSLENRRLIQEIEDMKSLKQENDDLSRTVKELRTENEQLTGKVNLLQENLKELDSGFKETRWALTAEVAEKHDMIQELRRCISALEEQLRQADMQTHFKDDIIKEMRKELKNSKKSQNLSKLKTALKPFQFEVPAKEDDMKLNIHIFPINEDKNENETLSNKCSVGVQTILEKSVPKTRNVSTQHSTRNFVIDAEFRKRNSSKETLPRSFGTLTVTPWSGAGGEGNMGDRNPEVTKEVRKNVKGIYTVPYGRG